MLAVSITSGQLQPPWLGLPDSPKVVDIFYAGMDLMRLYDEGGAPRWRALREG